MDELLGDFENDAAASDDTSMTEQTPMDQLERKKQNEARAFSKDLLANMFSDAATSNEDEPTTSRNVKRTLAPMEQENTEDADVVQRKIQRTSNVSATILKEEPNDDDADDEQQPLKKSMKKYKSIRTINVETAENCTHEVCLPIDTEYTPLVTKTGDPAKTYQFKLDKFQKAAIKCLDNNQSVLVSAHTSAGKTAVALYAIALALRDNQKVIYTSPIKALSNQKYRELSDEFEDVGLVTGDVTLNPTAACVVMTTEILRSMLYRGTEVIREVGWVIFDEIHYMRDKERGVVWEETIILLPDVCHYVFLSATIPNAKEFAQWIAYNHHQPCHVVYTENRPVPLQHLVFPAGGDGLFEVVDIKGSFKKENFKKAMGFLTEAQPEGANVRSRRSVGGGGGEATNKSVVKIIRTIQEKEMLPCIIFSFSRKECEMHASNIKQIDFNTEEEKEAIKMIFGNAVNLLSEEDRRLPQIKGVLPFLLRGIGIHHSGQLPIMKEIVEILFGEGLIKTLFATETFAMGVNMPAKTVLFTSARKFDGTNNRWISSGEYIQMSGRAGRRGKDEKGLVILMLDTQMSEEQAIQLIKGNSDPLNSQFRLTYNMVLNLLRVPEINPEYMLEKSFHQWQNYASLPALNQEVIDKKGILECTEVPREYDIKAYINLEKVIKQTKDSIREKVMKPSKVVPFFQPGRMLKLRHYDKDYDWGVLINWRKTPNPLNPTSLDMLYIVEVAVRVSPESERHLPNLSMVRPPDEGTHGVISVIPFTFDCITAISTIRLKIPQEMTNREARQAVAVTLAETKKRFNNMIPELDPIEHMNVSDPLVKGEIKKLQEHEQRYNEAPIKYQVDFDQIYKAYQNKVQIEEDYKAAKKRYEDAKKLLQKEELQSRKRVLQRLCYSTEDDTITAKGRVACELSSADELLLTEMIFSGTFNEMEPEEAAALLSCFVFEERTPSGKLSDKLSGYLRIMQTTAKQIAKICNECRLEVDEEKYVEKFGSGMMDVVHNWCRGATFAQIMENTQIFEGSVIRCMRRLDELLQEMTNAAKALKETKLVEKFDKARELLKRDIVFSASLYL